MENMEGKRYHPWPANWHTMTAFQQVEWKSDLIKSNRRRKVVKEMLRRARQHPKKIERDRP